MQIRELAGDTNIRDQVWFLTPELADTFLFISFLSQSHLMELFEHIKARGYERQL